MKNLYATLFTLALILSSSTLHAAIGDTIIQDNIKYNVTKETESTGEYEVNVYHIYKQANAKVPASIFHNGKDYKITTDYSPQLYESGNSINPIVYPKIDFSQCIYMRANDVFSGNMYGVDYTVVDTLILPPTLKRLPFIVYDKINTPSDYFLICPVPPNQGPYMSRIKRVFSSGNNKVIIGKSQMDGFSYNHKVIEVDISTLDMDSLLSMNAQIPLHCIGTFEDCVSLEKVRLPEKLKYIGPSSFENTPRLKDIKLPDSLESIDNLAFHNSQSLDSIYIPKYVREINSSAFMANYKLKRFTVNPDNLHFKDEDGVLFSKSGRSIHFLPLDHHSDRYVFPEEVDSIRGLLCSARVNIGGDFEDSLCWENAAKHIVFNTGLSYMIEEAFFSSTITVAENFENTNIFTIPNNCFSGSTLTEISLPEEISKIEKQAFHFCFNLDHIVFTGKYIGEIENDAFSGTNLKVLDLSQQTRLKVINSGLCHSCSSLRKVKLPPSIDSIGSRAFSECTSLDTLEVSALEPPKLGFSILYGNQVDPFESIDNRGNQRASVDKSKCLLLVPAQAIAKYKAAPVWKEFLYIEADTSVCVLTAEPNDSVMGEVSGGGVYRKGDEVDMGIRSNKGYRFVKWSDGYTESYRYITITSDTTITAIFEWDANETYYLSAYSNDNTMGMVEVEGDNYRYKYQDTTTVTAIAKEGFRFVSWKDGNTDNPRTVVVTSDTSFVATFVSDTVRYTLNVEVENPEHGTVSGSGEYGASEKVVIEAFPSENYIFKAWNDLVTENPRTLWVTQDTMFVATFEIETSTNDISERKVIVYTQKNTICIEGEFSLVEIYSSQGELIYRGVDKNIRVGNKGVYLVRVDEYTTKIMME